ncbi:hypothetical protein CFB40_34390 [Burkholderia sp. AU31652]|uniref:hypothetical protein n=1 Tax=Burkholderia TaxID=32008 RepID=UPI000B91EFF2|nr:MULTISPECIES: hypothetical protein [Burkholderia]OXI79412.1 hypothetical protein CFB40_34390 [Burkholderia sp. AU31652]
MGALLATGAARALALAVADPWYAGLRDRAAMPELSALCRRLSIVHRGPVAEQVGVGAKRDN